MSATTWNCDVNFTNDCGIQNGTPLSQYHKGSLFPTSTERQEAVDAGFARLVGVEPGDVIPAVKKWWVKGTCVARKKSPFGDGTAAQRSVEILKNSRYIS